MLIEGRDGGRETSGSEKIKSDVSEPQVHLTYTRLWKSLFYVPSLSTPSLLLKQRVESQRMTKRENGKTLRWICMLLAARGINYTKLIKRAISTQDAAVCLSTHWSSIALWKSLLYSTPVLLYAPIKYCCHLHWAAKAEGKISRAIRVNTENLN